MPTTPLDATTYTAASYAQQTRIAYTADWEQFLRWCATHDHVPLPATPTTVVAFIVAHATAWRPATIARRLSAIRWMHQQADALNPTDHPHVATVLRGIRRVRGTAPVQKAPITTDLLRQLLATTGDDLRGIQARAILLLGFASALRRSEIVALTVADLLPTPDGLVLTIRRSKTDQEQRGMRRGIPRGQHPETCAVRAVAAWRTAAAIAAGPLFRPVYGRGAGQQAGDRALHPATVARIVQRAVAQLGLDPAAYGGHSLRAGLVTSAAIAGVGYEAMLRQTGHQDLRSLRRYIRDPELFRDNAAAHVGL